MSQSHYYIKARSFQVATEMETCVSRSYFDAIYQDVIRRSSQRLSVDHIFRPPEHVSRKQQKSESATHPLIYGDDVEYAPNM